MKSIIATGKRKTSVARATITTGTGKVSINNVSLESYEPALARLKLKEPLILAGNMVDKLDIKINVFGGGFMSRTEASRLAVAKALVAKNEKLKEVFLNYDRQLLVADVRRKEVKKPNTRGKARAKRQKSYR